MTTFPPTNMSLNSEKDEQDPLDDEEAQDDYVSSDDEEEKQEELEKNAAKENGEILRGIISCVKEVNSDGKEINKKRIAEGLQKFIGTVMETNKAHLEKKATNRKTILHMIADAAIEDKKGVINLKPLIAHLTQHHRHLTLQINRDELTPLHYAIKKKASRVVEYMVAALDTPSKELKPTLKEVVLKTGNGKNNCLHSAVVDARSKSKIILSLIKRVRDPEIVCAKNPERLTPLHLAVEYGRCSENQVTVVEEMIKHWNVALDVNVLSEEGKGSEERSVFRHHEWSRAREQKPRRGNPTNPQKPKKEPSSETKVRESGAPTPVPQPIKPSSVSTGNKSNQTMQPVSDKPTSKNSDDSKPALYGQGIQRQGTASEKGFQDHVRSKEDKTTGHGKALGKKNTKGDAMGKTQPKDWMETTKPIMTQDDAADRIRDKLKMHYMCTRDDHRQILSFLYGPHEGRYQLHCSTSEYKSVTVPNNLQ